MNASAFTDHRGCATFPNSVRNAWRTGTAMMIMSTTLLAQAQSKPGTGVWSASGEGSPTAGTHAGLPSVAQGVPTSAGVISVVAEDRPNTIPPRSSATNRALNAAEATIQTLATATADFDMNGCLLAQVKGPVFGLVVADDHMFQVSGADLAANVGNRVHIVGAKIAPTATVKNLKEAVAVTQVETTAAGGCLAAADRLSRLASGPEEAWTAEPVSSASEEDVGTVPTGTGFSVRLIDPVRLTNKDVGHLYRASLDQDILLEDRVAVPKNADVILQLRTSASADDPFSARLILIVTGLRVNGVLRSMDTSEALPRKPEQRAPGAVSRTRRFLVPPLLGAVCGAVFGSTWIGAATGLGVVLTRDLARSRNPKTLPSESQLWVQLQAPLNPRGKAVRPRPE